MECLIATVIKIPQSTLLVIKDISNFLKDHIENTQGEITLNGCS